MNFKEEKNHILNLLVEYLTPKNSIKRFNAITGDVLEYGESYEDLADYLPFIDYYKKDSLYHSELKKTIRHLKNNEYIYVKKDKFPLGCFSRSYAQSDLLFGLILAAKKEKKYLKEAKKTALTWYYTFFNKTPSMFILRNIYNIKLPKVLNAKIKILSAEDHGMFIELFTLLYQITKEKKFLDISLEIYEKMKDSNSFKKYGYFDFYSSDSFLFNSIINNVNVFSKRKSEFQLLKQNSNSFFGMISLYYVLNGKSKELMKKDLIHSIDSYIKNFYDQGKKVFYTNYNTKSKKKGSDLSVFHVIELLIEMYLITNSKKYLKVASDIVKTYFKLQSKETGLLPFINTNLKKQDLKRFKIPTNESWLDAEIDFLVAAMRLNQITKNKTELKSIENLLFGIIKYHKKEHGYVSQVNIFNGKTTNPIYSTKMLALVLKAFIAYENRDNLLNRDDDIYYVLQDR